MAHVFEGIWPVAPTPFRADGTLDLPGMKRVLDCMIDQGVDGLCILANFSEQFALEDAERETLARLCMEHIAGRVPVIITISHLSTGIAVQRARLAKSLGAAVVMMMPPYHGATIRGTPAQVLSQFRAVGEVGVPIMVQDAPLSGVDLPVPLLQQMAREIEMVQLVKIEVPGAAAKLRALAAGGSSTITGLFDGEESVTLLADLHAGANGSMASAMVPDLIKPVISHFRSGDRAAATAAYARVLPAINHENRQCGFRAAKAALLAGGVISSDFCRPPMEPLDPSTRAQLLELLRPLDPVALRWGH